jgi:hypothetical protein
MDFAPLGVLKTKLIESDDFSAILDYFIDNIGEQPDFRQVGAPMRNAIMEESVAQTVAHMLNQTTPKIAALVILGFPNYHFMHGTLHMSDEIAVFFFFFDDINKGMVAVCGARDDDKMMFARFSAFPLNKPEDPLRN